MGAWITTESHGIVFEDNSIGRMKKEIWDVSEKEIDHILGDYEIPYQLELGKPSNYLQTTI